MNGMFPTNVKIVSLWYEIIQQEEVLCDGKAVDGTCVFQEQKILIQRSLTDQLKVKTLWHELTHAINNEMGIEDDAQEEFVATQQAAGWICVIRDNPTLLPHVNFLVNGV